MTATPPIAAADFKTKFDREFIYGSGVDTVRDKDINDAIAEAQLMYNASLWAVADGKQAFLYLTAHFLIRRIQAAGGLAPAVTGDAVSNRAAGVVQSKSVGQVSVSYAPPPARVLKMAFLLPMWETDFGRQYVTMLLPKLSGNVNVVSGPVDNTGGAGAIPFVGP